MPAIDSAKRTLSRVRDLLANMQSTMKETWLFEVTAHFNECIGRADQAIEELMKEYRSLVSFRGWETDSGMIVRICRVLTQISELNIEEGDVANLKKFKLVNGVIKRFKTAYFDESKIPAERVVELEKILADVEAAI